MTIPDNWPDGYIEGEVVPIPFDELPEDDQAEILLAGMVADSNDPDRILRDMVPDRTWQSPSGAA